MVLRNKLTKQLIAGLALFAVSAIVSHLARPHLYQGAVYLLATLVPVFPAIFVGFTVARIASGLDELQRKIQLHALAFSLATTILVLLAAGLLGAEVWPASVAITIAIFWILGWAVTRRRYA
jgi:sorbitol-specific phosphotransferase system component IIC